MVRYCKCGQEVWVIGRWNGFKYIQIFTNQRNREEKYTHCPGCGDQLRFENLVEEIDEEPKTMKSRDELREAAHFKGVLILTRDVLGNPKTTFSEMEHYFNKDMQEIGNVFDPFGLEIVNEFNPPRIWDKSFFPGYIITPLKGEQKP